MNKERRIVWNQEEKAVLFDEMVSLLIKNPNLSVRDVLIRAQNRLPHDRRRAVSYNTVFSYKNLVAKAQTIAARKAAEAAREAPPAPVAASVEATPEPTLEQRISEVLEQIIAKVARDVAQQVVDDLVRRNFQIHAPRSVVVEPVAEEPESEPVKKAKRTSVVIIGLNGHQMSLTKTRFPNLDITFISANDAVSGAVVKKEHTILMTKFISHSAQNRYRQTPNLQYCNGGLTDLSAMLNRIQ